jgi:hypothetical protein
MSNQVDQFVDQVYDELERLYAKDKNFKKGLLGNEPIKKMFDIYGDWLAVNVSLSPKVAANTIYKDAIGVGYLDFAQRKIKRGVQIQGMPSFNLIYGTQKEIDQAMKMMAQVKIEDPKKYDLVLLALEKVKEVSDGVKPAKNIFGKTTNVAKQQVMNLKMPKLSTLETFLKLSENQLRSYVAKLHVAATKDQERVAAKKNPASSKI